MKNKVACIFLEVSKTTSWSGKIPISVYDKNIFDDTPLHTVCTWGDSESALTLIEAGADPNSRGDVGCTPLFNAIISRNHKMVKILLENGADPRLRNDIGSNAVDYAISTNSDKKIVEQLKSKKAIRKRY